MKPQDKYTEISEPIKIIGIQIKTTNDNCVAFKEIPLHWEKFFSEAVLDKIPNKTSKEIYGVYTNFENEGKNNEGEYSFTIGAPVNSLDVIPDGFESVVIPNSSYQVFSSENGQPEKIGEKWQEIWKHDFQRTRTHFLEFEKYSENNDIDIFIGVR